MVDPADVPRIVNDAARLGGSGELIVIGSAALAFWLRQAPQGHCVELIAAPKAIGGKICSRMGAGAWYQETLGAYVEVWEAETFAAPATWRVRAERLELRISPHASIVVPHPWDILFSKLERSEPKDIEHREAILAEHPIDRATALELAEAMPHRTGAIVDEERVARFEFHLARWLKTLGP